MDVDGRFCSAHRTSPKGSVKNPEKCVALNVCPKGHPPYDLATKVVMFGGSRWLIYVSGPHRPKISESRNAVNSSVQDFAVLLSHRYPSKIVAKVGHSYTEVRLYSE